MNDEEIRKALRTLKRDFSVYAPRFLHIRAKDGAIIPFRMNKAQQYLHGRIEHQRERTGKVRILGLKGRQQGFSTYTEARLYWLTSLNQGRRAYILTHLAEATANLFGMTRRYHDLCPEFLRPNTRANSGSALIFDELQSEFSVATAGSSGTGRSATAQYFHGCLHPDTLIIDGITGHLVKMGDMLIGRMVRTHTGSVAPISFISHQQKDAYRILLKGMQQIPLVATAEHRFWTKSGWKELRDISAGDFIGLPVAVITDDRKQWKFRQPDSIRPQGGGTSETGPDYVRPSYELGRILGLYLADGCIIKQSKTGVPSAITFAVHERETPRTEQWLNSINDLFVSIKTRPTKASKTVFVTAYGKSFAKFVMGLCGETDDKHVPQEWSKCGPGFVKGLIHGYLAGDGHSSKRPNDRRISAPSIRPAITVGIRDCLASMGYGFSCIGYREGALRNGRNEKPQWILRICGVGVDRLCEEMGMQMPPRRRTGAYGEVQVTDGYAWIPVVSIEFIGQQPVMDFEVDHEDHSYCTVHGATHNSEIAFWPNAAEHMAGIGQIVPDAPGTEIILESTANGVGNLFHGMWQDAEAGITEYLPVFVPWFWQEEYTKEPPAGWSPSGEDADYAAAFGLTPGQAYWKQQKTLTDFRGDRSLFDQEYPGSAALAFKRVSGDPLIAMDVVLAAIAQGKAHAEAAGAEIWGLDVAEYGSDDTALVRRKGRVVTSIQCWNGKGTMETVGLVAHEVDKGPKPDMINVDCTGVGTGVADRLLELGYPVNRIHFGERAVQTDLYAIRRDEMWCEMRDWLQEKPASIPDDNRLIADLTGPNHSYDSSRRLKLETKESMRKRGLRSPDLADAMALTFAIPYQNMERNAVKHDRRSNWRI